MCHWMTDLPNPWCSDRICSHCAAPRKQSHVHIAGLAATERIVRVAFSWPGSCRSAADRPPVSLVHADRTQLDRTAQLPIRDRPRQPRQLDLQIELGVWRMDTARLSCSSARGWCCVMALPCSLKSAARGTMKAGTRYLTLARYLTDVDFGPHMGCMHMACRGMYLGVTTTIPTGGRLDMTLPPLRAVLYGPVRRPSVSRVDLTVTVFRSQIFGPFIAHTPTI